MKGCYKLILALLISAGSVIAQPGLDDNVHRIINTLASDEMNGRYAFGSEIWEAAAFISSEFEQIGLEKGGNDGSYLQVFPMYETKTKDVSVSVNGTMVPADRFAASMTSESIHWMSADDVHVEVVGPEDNLMTVLRARRGEGNTLLFVNPDQAERFNQLRRFLPAESRSRSAESGANMVMVLGEWTDESSFDVKGAATRSEIRLANVVGRIEGKRPNEIVLFTAHYDHEPMREGDADDLIMNGANDNASGTTAVIELARYYAAMDQPERTLLFVAFTAEERGGLGSRYFSEQMDPERIVAMFNIEMIGKPAVEGPNTAWITGFDRSDFGTILQEAVEGTPFEFYPDPYPTQNLFYRSDNATLARLGVPAHTISTTPIDVDKDYHQASDEVETLDLAHLANTIKAIAAGATLIISGERTPTRIDPTTVN